MNLRQCLDQLISHSAETSVYLKRYLRYQLEYFKLDAVEKLALLLSKASQGLFIGFFALLAFVFLCFSLAFWLGALWASMSLGFLAVGSSNLILALLFFRFGRKALGKRIERTVVESAFDESGKHEA